MCGQMVQRHLHAKCARDKAIFKVGLEAQMQLCLEEIGGPSAALPRVTMARTSATNSVAAGVNSLCANAARESSNRGTTVSCVLGACGVCVRACVRECACVCARAYVFVCVHASRYVRV